MLWFQRSRKWPSTCHWLCVDMQRKKRDRENFTKGMRHRKESNLRFHVSSCAFTITTCFAAITTTYNLQNFLKLYKSYQSSWNVCSSETNNAASCFRFLYIKWWHGVESDLNLFCKSQLYDNSGHYNDGEDAYNGHQ